MYGRAPTAPISVPSSESLNSQLPPTLHQHRNHLPLFTHSCYLDFCSQTLSVPLSRPIPKNSSHTIYPPLRAFDRPPATAMALDTFFHNKIEQMKLEIIQGQAVLRRLEAQRNDYNSRVRLLREELGLLQQPGSYVGEVVKVMGTKKVLVKVHPEGKYGKSCPPRLLASWAWFANSVPQWWISRTMSTSPNSPSGNASPSSATPTNWKRCYLHRLIRSSLS